MKKKTGRKVARKLSVQNRSSWIEIFAYGISASAAEGRPVLILKDLQGENALPVWLSPVTAALALSGGEPHTLVSLLLQQLGVKITHCHIDELVGHRQYARLFFKGSDSLKSLRLRADEALSFSLAFKAKLFSTREFMMRCRDVDSELMKLEHGLSSNPEIGSKNHPYVM
jgi:bifunctional DNase/RNase